MFPRGCFGGRGCYPWGHFVQSKAVTVYYDFCSAAMLTTIVKGICELCHRYVLQVKKDRSTASSLGLPVGVHSAWGGKTEGAGGGGGLL